MSEGSLINSLMQPVLGRLVKRAVASMEEYQSKKSLLPMLTFENVATEEDEEALSRALGGTTRLVSRKQGSNAGSRGTSETESLPPSSPREVESLSLNRMDSSSPPQHPASSPAATLVPPFSHNGSPRTEWHNNWGLPESQYTYPTYPTNTANTQWPTATPGGWYNNPQPVQFHDPTSLPPQHQHPHLHHQQPPYLTVDVTMGNAFPSFGQTSSALSGAMSPYDYPQQQQQAPPQNNAHAQSWHNLFNEMGANYS
jgi:hypothetical protein